MLKNLLIKIAAIYDGVEFRSLKIVIDPFEKASAIIEIFIPQSGESKEIYFLSGNVNLINNKSDNPYFKPWWVDLVTE
jgi:hypothetical protein